MVESEKGVSDIWIFLGNKILKLFSSHMHWLEISSWQIHLKLKIDQNVTYTLFALNHSFMLGEFGQGGHVEKLSFAIIFLSLYVIVMGVSNLSRNIKMEMLWPLAIDC